MRSIVGERARHSPIGVIATVVVLCTVGAFAGLMANASSPTHGGTMFTAGIRPPPGDYVAFTCPHGAIYLNGSQYCHDQSNVNVPVCGTLGTVCIFAMYAVMDSGYQFGGWSASGDSHLGLYPNGASGSSANPTLYYGVAAVSTGTLTLNNAYTGSVFTTHTYTPGIAGYDLVTTQAGTLYDYTSSGDYQQSTNAPFIPAPWTTWAQGVGAGQFMSFSPSPGCLPSAGCTQILPSSADANVQPGYICPLYPCSQDSGYGAGSLDMWIGDVSKQFTYNGQTGYIDIKAGLSAYGTYAFSNGDCGDYSWALAGLANENFVVMLRSGGSTGAIIASTNYTLASTGWMSCTWGSTWGTTTVCVFNACGQSGGTGTMVWPVSLTNGKSYSIEAGIDCSSIAEKYSGTSGATGGTDTDGTYGCGSMLNGDVQLTSLTYTSS
jgi:hypothetical protein